MSNLKRISEIADIRQGRYLAPAEMFEFSSPEAPIPVWGANGILGYTQKPTYSYRVPLVTCRGNGCGLIQWPCEQSYISNNAMGLAPKTKNELDSSYLYYSLLVSDFSDVITGSAQPQITVAHLSSKRVAWAEDKAIRAAVARFLSAFDKKIDINRRINQNLEAIAQAIFKSWFVDFDPVKAKIAAIQQGQDPLRAAMQAISGKTDAELDQMPREHHDQLAVTAALFPHEMEETELGEVPKGWKVSKVEALLTRLSAKTRYTKDQILEYGEIPVFEQGASIILGYHDGSATYQASIDEPAFIFGDHTCVTRLSCQPFDISQNVIPLRGNGRATAWVYYSIKEKQKFQEYRRHWAELISKYVVVAAADACLEFSQKVSILHLQIEENERQMQTLRELRDTLLPRLLSGEMPVLSLLDEGAQ